jgi:integrase
MSHCHMPFRITKRSVDAEKAAAKDRFLWDEDPPGFGLKITPAGRKVYVFQYRMGGRTSPARRYTIGPHGRFTPDEARRAAHRLREKVNSGIDPMAEKLDGRRNTVRAMVAGFVESRRTKGRRSADAIERVLNREVVAVWKDRPAASITAQDATALVEDIANRGAKIQANRVASYLKTMFRWAAKRGTVPASPVLYLDKPATEQSRERTPSLAELVEIWRAAESLGYPFGPAYKLLILTGQRRDEVAGVEWPEIDRGAALWTIPGEKAKNGITHDVHLSALALEVLQECPEVADQDLIFSTTGKTPISGWGKVKARIDKKIMEARQAAAVAAGRDPTKVKPMAPWVTHDIRRGFATGLNGLGVMENVADRILNHTSKTKGGVKRVYNRSLYAAERRAAMDLWADALTQALKKTA